jgi:hypothetical protein
MDTSRRMFLKSGNLIPRRIAAQRPLSVSAYSRVGTSVFRLSARLHRRSRLYRMHPAKKMNYTETKLVCRVDWLLNCNT